MKTLINFIPSIVIMFGLSIIALWQNALEEGRADFTKTTYYSFSQLSPEYEIPFEPVAGRIFNCNHYTIVYMPSIPTLVISDDAYAGRQVTRVSSQRALQTADWNSFYLSMQDGNIPFTVRDECSTWSHGLTEFWFRDPQAGPPPNYWRELVAEYNQNHASHYLPLVYKHQNSATP